ncbi:hypothetical protein OHA91_20955 [Streptomyces erythrochromogenes]|uniref:Uncharacterized protein n=1 Tax=Streptomyces erythrochromogenes TaxID=285574 RepID=A0ABZ1QDQ3_9ACTN|nr:hypothetical protein [Streptomyces erythrochromogenes]
MGNSVAHPVLRTADPAEAYAKARHLCGLLAERYAQVYVGAVALTVADLRRLAGLLPDAIHDYVEGRSDPVTGETLYFALDVATAADTELTAELPLYCAVEELPGGVRDEDFVRAVGAGPASVRWEGCWPDEPEFGSYPSPGYDGVQLVLNSDESQWCRRTTGVHSLYVHVTKHGDPGRAERLAAAIGGAVLGEPEQG